MKIEYIMSFLDELTKYSNYKKFPVASAIIYKNKIISTGVNSFTKTSPLQYSLRQKINPNINKKLPYVHAEVKSISSALHTNIDLSKCSIFISRINKNGRCISKPCDECMYLIRKYKFKSVIYYNEFGEIVQQFLKKI